MSGHAIQTQRSLLTMTYKHCFFAIHAVKLYVDFVAIVVFGIKGKCLKCNSQVEIDNFKGSQEDISYKITVELCTHHKVNNFLLFILFESNAFVLLQKKRFLPTELQQNCFASSVSELLDDTSVHVTVIERNKKST